MAELSFWLDSYNDIYSDFDNRNYSHRRISEDFLHELREELKYGEPHSSNIILFLPQANRLEEHEPLIAASLKNQFITRYHLHREKCRKKINSALALFLAGVVVMLVNTWISFYAYTSFLATGLRVLFEPAGWFMIWIAFDFMFYDFPILKKEKQFYRRLSEMHIRFNPA